MTSLLSRILVAIFACSVCLLTATSNAQQSLFQSAAGDSALFLPGGSGTISYNLGSDSARFDFERDHGGRSAFGGGVGGTVKAGAGSVLNKNSPAPGGFVEAGYIFRFVDAELPPECTVVTADSQDLTVVGPGNHDPENAACFNNHFLHYAIIQYHYGRDQFYLLGSTTPPIPNPTQVNFNEHRATVAYNGLVQSDAVSLRFGVTYYAASSNDLSDLKEQTYQNTVLSTAGNSQTSVASSSKTVYVGTYSTHTAQSINGDFVVQPGKSFGYQFALDFMFRSDLAGGPGVSYLSPGMGIYFFKKGSPVSPVAGISYSYKNGDSSVAIIAGWSFGGTPGTK